MTTDFFWLTTFGLSDDEYDERLENANASELRVKAVLFSNHTLKKYCPLSDVYNVITDYCLQYYMREIKNQKNKTWTLQSEILTKGDSFRKHKYIQFYFCFKNQKDKHVFLTVDESGGETPALTKIRTAVHQQVSTLHLMYCLNMKDVLYYFQ